MKRKKIFITILLMAVLQSVYGQSPAGGDPNKTNVPKATMSPQGNPNVSADLFSGTASFSVPIYSYTIDNLDLGISLNYDCRGIPVDMLASDIGIGWSLQGIPSIERRANGIEDEIALRHGNDSVEGTWIYRKKSPNNADVFSVHLGNADFKFTLSPKGIASYCDTCLLQAIYPNDEYKIYLYYSNFADSNRVPGEITFAWYPDYHATNFLFKIVDSKGNQYYFDSPDAQIFKEYEWLDESTSYYDVNTKWWVSKIVTATGKVITYDYDNVSISYDQYRREEIIEDFPVTTTIDQGTFYGLGKKPFFKKSRNVEWAGDVKRIRKITYPNKTAIDFVDHASIFRKDVSGVKVLAKIVVRKGYDSASSNRIEYGLGHSYFYVNGPSYSKQLGDAMVGSALDYRLRLNTISRMVNNDYANSKIYYTFEYNSTPLPPRLSPMQDYFGFYNGKSPVMLSSGDFTVASGEDLPTFSIPYHRFNWSYSFPVGSGSYDQTYGHMKTPDSSYMAAGILIRATNGMNGTISFFYEPHQVQDYNAGSRTWCSTKELGTNRYDGLRIQRIEYHDGFSSDNNTTTRYTYEDGYRYYRNIYYWYPFMYPDYMPVDANLSEVEPVSVKWFSKPVSEMDLEKTNQGYLNVTTTNEGYGGEVLSKNKSTFSGLTRIDQGQPVPYITETRQYYSGITSSSYTNHSNIGLLLAERQYIGNADTPFQIKTYEYEPSTVYADRNKMPRWGSYSTGINRNIFSALSFKKWVDTNFKGYERKFADAVYNSSGAVMGTGMIRLKKERTLRISGGTTSLDSTIYEYDKWDNVTTIRWKDSRGADFIKNLIYDYNSDTTMTTQYKLQEITRKGTSVLDPRVAMSRIDYYKNTLVPTKEYMTRRFHTDKVSNSADQFTFTTTVDEENTEIDSAGNIAEARTEDTALYRSQIWDKKISEKIADATNAKLSEIAYTSFEGFTASASYSYYDRGNWNFNTAQVFLGNSLPGTSHPSSARTGKYCYRITNNASDIISRAIPNDKMYYLTFWADKTCVVKLNSTTLTPKVSISTPDWQLYTYIIPLSIGNPPSRVISIENVSSIERFIDELRLHPFGATMTTYTHEPLLGVSSVSDARNNILFTEYDGQGNAYIIRDIYGNIVSQTDRMIRTSKW